MKRTTTLALALCCAWGCSTTMSQAKVAVADDNEHVARQDALAVMTHAICKKYTECDQIGSGKKYPTTEDCMAQESMQWSKVWSEESCGGKGVLAGKLKECEQRAMTWACGNNILDFGGLVTECGAGSVCK